MPEPKEFETKLPSNTPADDPLTRPQEMTFQVMPTEGTKLSAPKPASPPPVPKASGHQMDAAAPSPAENHHEQNGHFFNSKIVYVTISLLLIAAFGAAAYFFIYGKKPAEPEPAATLLTADWLQQHFGSPTCTDQSVCGDSADPDNDGLTNLEEFKVRRGTDPNNPDTDGDGLADGDEAKVYLTEPALRFSYCTDNTGLQCQYDDGSQISNNYDPKTPGIKMTQTRLEQINERIDQYHLHAPTQATLDKAKASADTEASTPATEPAATLPAGNEPQTATP
jgi:hypothetical protein